MSGPWIISDEKSLGLSFDNDRMFECNRECGRLGCGIIEIRKLKADNEFSAQFSFGNWILIDDILRREF